MLELPEYAALVSGPTSSVCVDICANLETKDMHLLLHSARPEINYPVVNVALYNPSCGGSYCTP